MATALRVLMTDPHTPSGTKPEAGISSDASATTLPDKAMLVSITICAWTARRHDKRLSDEVALRNHADRDAGRYNKHLIAKEALATISAIANEARSFHYTNTLPWHDNGYRILPTANYMAYTQAMAAFRSRFTSAIAAFLRDYDRHVWDARQRLGAMFNPADYPNRTELADRFAFERDFMALPVGKDFRLALQEDERDRIRAQIDARLSAATANATRDLYMRIALVVEHMANRLSSYGVDPVTGKVRSAFRDSLVENVRDLVDLLPRLNVLGDAHLDALRQRMADQLCPTEPQTLREDPIARQQTAAAAQTILAEMADYLGSDTQ